MNKKVELKNVYKLFPMHAKQTEKLFDLFSLKRKKISLSKNFLALRNVSFSVDKGEVVGIVGLNGSGKSTLSNLLGKVYEQSSGDISIDGETSLIAISAGLNASLSGMENIELKCLMHGLNKTQIDQITPDIVEFADIGDYIYQPVKNYSSGMKSRLGFAISVHTNPDILVIDEALSVGDSTFANKCLRKMKEFKKEGKTIFFISHSIAQVRDFCDKVIWMHYGELKEIGKAEDVIKDYNEFVNWFNKLSQNDKNNYKANMLKQQMEEKQNLDKQINKKSRYKYLNLLWDALIVGFVLYMGTLMVMGY